MESEFTTISLDSHMNLKGRTPAEEAGLSLHLEENKWLALIRNASK